MSHQELSEIELELYKQLLKRLGLSRFATISESAVASIIDQIQISFPFVGSQISWNQTHGHCSSKWNRDDEEDSLCEAANRVCGKVIDMNLVEMDEELVILGDSAIDIGIMISWANFVSCLDIFSDLPQHTYVVAQDLRWCLTISLEGYVDWGLSSAR